MRELVKVGDRYGRLEVIGRESDYEYKKNHFTKMWKCRCDCGKIIVTKQDYLRAGGVKSCGCLNRDVHAKVNGLSHHPLYRKWQSMIRRCHNPDAQAFDNYGGRGISVCKEWKDSYLAFYEWCMKSGYKEGTKLSLDRIDNDGDYEPANCRWVDYVAQQNNKRRSRKVAFDGKVLTTAQWEREIGLHRYTIIGRLNRGWDCEKALTTPVEDFERKIKENKVSKISPNNGLRVDKMDVNNRKQCIRSMLMEFLNSRQPIAEIEWEGRYNSVESARNTIGKIAKEESLPVKIRIWCGRVYAERKVME